MATEHDQTDTATITGPELGQEPVESYARSAFWRLFPAGMRRRWWTFRLFDLLARWWPVAGPLRGLLVVRMDGIGDMVLFRNSLDRYAEVFGVARDEITVLGCDSWAGIAAPVFAGYAVISIDEHSYARDPLYRFRVNLKVRRLAPRIAVCDSYLRRALMADSLVWASAAPLSVVSRPYISERTRPEFTYYLSQASRIIDTGHYPTHEVVRHARFLSAVAGRTIPPEAPRIPWPERPCPIEPGAPYIVLNPGSNEPGRRWPAGHYGKLAKRLREADYRVVLVGGQGDRSTAEATLAEAGSEFVLDLTGHTDLAGLLDVMAGAAAVVSNDSGPAHLAIAQGTPTVTIVGGGHFGSFFPYPEGVAPPHARFVHRPMDCYHCFWRCHRRDTKFDVFPCVEHVPLDEVWEALQSLLAPAARAAAVAGD